ncbi:MAG: zeta toxin family protein [Pseudonocardiaceae bacterium]
MAGTHAPALARRPVLLAIAGDSAAGKTTLTNGLVKALGGRCVSVCVDDYHRYDRHERKTLPFTALHPDCNYSAAARRARRSSSPNAARPTLSCGSARLLAATSRRAHRCRRSCCCGPPSAIPI